MPAAGSGQKSHRVTVMMTEVALGDMHHAFAPHQFDGQAPNYCHSVYGVGQQKPANVGIRDLKQANFKLNKDTFESPNALFVNTGKLQANSDVTNTKQGKAAVGGSVNAIDSVNVSDLKQFNEFVVFDEAQVRMRFLVDCELILK